MTRATPGSRKKTGEKRESTPLKKTLCKQAQLLTCPQVLWVSCELEVPMKIFLSRKTKHIRDSDKSHVEWVSLHHSPCNSRHILPSHRKPVQFTSLTLRCRGQILSSSSQSLRQQKQTKAAQTFPARGSGSRRDSGGCLHTHKVGGSGHVLTAPVDTECRYAQRLRWRSGMRRRIVRRRTGGGPARRVVSR